MILCLTVFSLCDVRQKTCCFFWPLTCIHSCLHTHTQTQDLLPHVKLITRGASLCSQTSKALVSMATCSYSDDLQPQQVDGVTIATPATTTPSSVKTTHFLSEVLPTSGAISAAVQSATISKPRQDALCSQAAPTQARSQRAVVLATSTQQYVNREVQHSVVQKSNGQSSPPQYLIVTVTGEDGETTLACFIVLHHTWVTSSMAGWTSGSIKEGCTVWNLMMNRMDQWRIFATISIIATLYSWGWLWYF